MEVEHDVYDKPRVTSGRIVRGPVKGNWKYAYEERGGITTVTYSMDYEAAGFLMRPLMGIIDRQLPAEAKKTLLALKKYVESGRGPRPAAAPAVRLASVKTRPVTKAVPSKAKK